MCKNWVILGSVPETSHGEGSSPKRAAAWWRRLNGSILWRIMGETSDYDLKPLQLRYLVVRSNLEEHLNDDWIFKWRSHLLMTQALKKKYYTMYIYTHPQASSTTRLKCCCFKPWRKTQPWAACPTRCRGFTEGWKVSARKMQHWQETGEMSGVGAPFLHDFYGDLRQHTKQNISLKILHYKSKCGWS